jgi:hypothetical protein
MLEIENAEMWLTRCAGLPTLIKSKVPWILY